MKNDTLNPSGSLKDRASLLVVAQANMMGYDEIVTASTGNAASALACISAAARKKAIIFAPANAPKAKLIQILQLIQIHQYQHLILIKFIQCLVWNYSMKH